QVDLVVSIREYSPAWQDKIAVLNLAGALKPGWPVSVANLSALHLAVADVKGDGTRKILAGGGSNLNVLNADGTALAGWPHTESNASFGPIAVGDLTGDGVPEIVVARTNIVASIALP